MGNRTVVVGGNLILLLYKVVRNIKGEAIWKGEIGSDLTFEMVDSDLSYFESNGFTDLFIHIQSVGGSLSDAVSIINRIKSSTSKVTFIIDSFVGSAGTLISISGDQLLMPSNAKFAIHNCYKTAIYDVDENAALSAYEELKELNSISKQMYLEKAKNIDESKLSELMDATTYLNAEECLTYGFCDRILEPSEVFRVGKEISQKLLKIDSTILQQMIEIDDFKGIKHVTEEEIKKVETPKESEEDVGLTEFLKTLGIKS